MVTGSPFGIFAMLMVLPALAGLALIWRRRPASIITGHRVGILRRLVAVYADFFVVMYGLIPVTFIPMLLIEFLATGQWQWNAEQDTLHWTDILIFPVMVVYAYGGFTYFSWHFKRRKQTFGQYLMGFTLIESGPNPSLLMRGFSALIILSWWPLWPWTLFKRRDTLLWDEHSHIAAQRVTYHNRKAP